MIRIIFLAYLLLYPAVSWAASRCICVTCIFGNLAHHYILSEAMAPALPVGACIFARQIHGDVSLLRRGDIITFDEDGVLFVFRLIGLPGDRIQLRDGVLQLNDNAVPQSPLPTDRVIMQENGFGGLPRCKNQPKIGQDCLRDAYLETLPNGVSYSILDISTGFENFFDDTNVYNVPADHVFVLGDHRDNSSDSRVRRAAGGRGMVPFAAIRGVVEEIKK